MATQCKWEWNNADTDDLTRLSMGESVFQKFCSHDAFVQDRLKEGCLSLEDLQKVAQARQASVERLLSFLNWAAEVADCRGLDPTPICSVIRHLEDNAGTISEGMANDSRNFLYRLMFAVKGGNSVDRDVVDTARAEGDPDNVNPPGGNNVDQLLQQIELATGDETTQRILVIANKPTLTADQKMELIVNEDQRFEGYTSTKWATLLCVSDAAIRQTRAWRKFSSRTE